MKTRKLIIALLSALSLAAFAQTAPLTPPSARESTEARLARGEPLVIGVRGSSSPLSFRDSGTFKGLAVDLCLNAFEKIKLKHTKATYTFLEITSTNRIDYLKKGLIDLECGSTTNTESRRKEVNFSIPYFFASVVAVKLKENSFNSVIDLNENTTIVYTEKTSAEQSLKNASISLNKKTNYKKIYGTTHQNSFSLLETKRADIFVNDDILIYNLIQKSPNPEIFQVLNERYSVEAYGIMTRLDDTYLTNTVDKSISEDMKSEVFDELYSKWFIKEIPPFKLSLNLKQSRLLKDVVRFPTKILGN